MSYSLDLKSSFFNKKQKKCCLRATVSGILAFLPITNGNIKISSEYPEILSYFNRLFSEFTYNISDVIKNGKLYFEELPNETVSEIAKSSGLKSFLCEFDSDCCVSSFLRGVFLADGSISSPEKEYRLEIRTYTDENAEFLLKILSKKSIFFKKSHRRGKTILYTRSADTIKDFLAEIGAVDFMFDYANAAIEKQLRNNINRHSNCDNANIDRILDAAESSIKAINYLEDIGILAEQSDEIQTVAKLRKEFDTDTLEQLGNRCTPSISKTKVFRIIKKLTKLAEANQKEGNN